MHILFNISESWLTSILNDLKLCAYPNDRKFLQDIRSLKGNKQYNMNASYQLIRALFSYNWNTSIVFASYDAIMDQKWIQSRFII